MPKETQANGADRSSLNEVVSVRLAEDEVGQLRKLAGEVPLSRFVRDLCLQAITRTTQTALAPTRTWSVSPWQASVITQSNIPTSNALAH